MLVLSDLIGLGADQFPLLWQKAASFASATSNTIIQGDSVAIGNTQAAIGANFTFVQKLKPGIFVTGVGGPYIRIRLTGPPSGSVATTISACYIGNAATSGNVYNFDGNQTLVSFGGSSVTLNPNQSIKSEAILPTTQIDWTKDVNIAFNVTSGSAYRYSTGLGANIIAYAKSGVSEASSTSKGATYTSAGSGSGRLNFLTGIETAS